ncbi:MAG TPA: DUF1800 domain-containing protein [Vicinamibacterales bacterium]|jgi:uncharacterized protein (DUF1800 family)
MKRFLAIGIAVSAISAQATTFPKDDQAIVHVLNRVAFGPAPGNVERVRGMGLQRYIDEQLRPERIADPAMASRLGGLTTTRMSSHEIFQQYEVPQLQARAAKKQNAKGNADGQDQASKTPPDPVQQRANSVVAELAEQKVLRAVYSERQLQEVLTDFWFNHFNIDARKGRDKFLLTEYERDTIRPHVLGKFRDLLGATAKSPAMLFYLDNWMSADPNGPHPTMTQGRMVRGPFGGRTYLPPTAKPAAQGKNAPKGLNENYGRELMELHTLGVDGGYTQKDVTEVARAFTGWTIEPPRQGIGFKFEPRIHDNGQKVVLGHVIKAGGGESDGEEVLDILARQPATAHFISTLLVRRFVSDTPPPALVDRAAARFHDTDGDLGEVMRTILTSPEFLSPEAYRAKVKTPFEFVVSALRATGADVADARVLVRELQQLGMPLYQCQPPTGYKDTGDAWVNTGALVSRMNFALRLSNNQVPRVTVVSLQSSVFGPAAGNSGQGEVDADAAIAKLLSGNASDSTRATIAKATTAPQMAALTLGSPEFQRR